MLAIEMVRDRVTKEPAVSERNMVIQECFQKGLLLLGCGTNSIRFCPPLIIDEQDVDVAIEIVDHVLSELPRRRRVI